MQPPLDDRALATVAEAIFRHGPADVLECDSQPGQDLRRFRTVAELLGHAHDLRQRGQGSLHIAVRYPDMGGESTPRRIDLCASEFDHRYTIEGWGLVRLCLPLRASPVAGFVSANSQRRAETWSPHGPMCPGPERWSWEAVARHLRRLRRALKVAVAEQVLRSATGPT